MRRAILLAAAPLVAFGALALARPTTANAQGFSLSIGTPSFYGSYYNGPYGGYSNPGCYYPPPVVYRSYYRHGFPAWYGRAPYSHRHHHHHHYGHGGHGPRW